tara:strand:- start:78 stop:1256 length:1179 start_codon:yes stop_codon:yes gene_type:complete
VRSIIPYAKHSISEEDIDAVKKTLKSKNLTQGPEVKKFESIFSKNIGVKHSIAVNSCTSALHLSCLALNLKKNDIVWTSPNSFVASSNSALYCGAKVDFIDIDLETNSISLNELEKKLKIAKKKKKLPKILISVHFGGAPNYQDKIHKLSKKYNFKIIEDACHALGAKYLNQKMGNCKWSDITVFSFHAAKVITTGEGGMVTTNNKELYNKILMLRSHGITRDPAKLLKNKNNRLYYEQQYLGYNFRLTDFQASLGISQLKKLNKFVNIRNKIALFYNKEFKKLPLKIPKIDKSSYSAYHLYVILLKYGIRKKLIKFLESKNIYPSFHYIPIYHQPYYKMLGFKKNNFPNTEEYFKSALSLPMYPTIKTVELKKITKNINLFFHDKKNFIFK